MKLCLAQSIFAERRIIFADFGNSKLAVSMPNGFSKRQLTLIEIARRENLLDN